LERKFLAGLFSEKWLLKPALRDIDPKAVQFLKALYVSSDGYRHIHTQIKAGLLLLNWSQALNPVTVVLASQFHCR
jgi:hypothetical protein